MTLSPITPAYLSALVATFGFAVPASLEIRFDGRSRGELRGEVRDGSDRRFSAMADVDDMARGSKYRVALHQYRDGSIAVQVFRDGRRLPAAHRRDVQTYAILAYCGLFNRVPASAIVECEMQSRAEPVSRADARRHIARARVAIESLPAGETRRLLEADLADCVALDGSPFVPPCAEAGGSDNFPAYVADKAEALARLASDPAALDVAIRAESFDHVTEWNLPDSSRAAREESTRADIARGYFGRLDAFQHAPDPDAAIPVQELPAGWVQDGGVFHGPDGAWREAPFAVVDMESALAARAWFFEPVQAEPVQAEPIAPNLCHVCRRPALHSDAALCRTCDDAADAGEVIYDPDSGWKRAGEARLWPEVFTARERFQDWRNACRTVARQSERSARRGGRDSAYFGAIHDGLGLGFSAVWNTRDGMRMTVYRDNRRDDVAMSHRAEHANLLAEIRAAPGPRYRRAELIYAKLVRLQAVESGDFARLP